MAAVRQLQDLSVQSVSDFFRSATRNMQTTIWLVRIGAIFLLFLLVSTIWSILVPEVRQLSNLTFMFRVLILYFFVVILALLTLVTFIAVPLAGGTAAVHYFLASRAFVINQIFGNIIVIDGLDEEDFFGASADPFGPMAYLLNKPQRELYNREFLHGYILLLLLIMIITGIGFIRRSSVSLAGLTLVISQIAIGHAYLKDLTIDLSLDTSSVTSTFGSSLFRLAFISYLYLEFSLQTGYLYSLTSPTLSRQERVGKQLSRLSQFRLGITKLGTEEEKQISEATKDEDFEEEEEKTATSLAAGSGSTSAKKYSADALLFLLDSAQDSLFAKPGGEQERLTGRLQRYHDGLLQHDPKLDDKLGGSAGKAFNPLIVLITVFTSLIFRLILLIILSWLVLKPEVMLTFIALPETILNSVEITQPEGILVVLIPVVFLIIGGSYLVARLQEWVVKAEELIIEEADIQRLLRAGRAITTAEEGEKIQEELEKQELEEQAKQEARTRPRRRRRRRRRE